MGNKINGYRELTATEIVMINEIKSIGPTVREILDRALACGADPRWTAIARTHFQQGIMALTRSIAKPDDAL